MSSPHLSVQPTDQFKSLNRESIRFIFEIYLLIITGLVLDKTSFSASAKSNDVWMVSNSLNEVLFQLQLQVTRTPSLPVKFVTSKFQVAGVVTKSTMYS